MAASRLAIALAGVTIALPALAQELTPAQARRFVIGKTFSYTCFEGTTGAGQIRGDGSVAGTDQIQGSGPVRHAALPAGTLQVRGEKVCASVKGIPFEPCFNLQQTSAKSFRGSVSGMGFAYCDFVRGGGGNRGRATFARSVSNGSGKPVALRPSVVE